MTDTYQISHPLNTAEVSRARILKNLAQLVSFNEKISIAPVLKSNAYGHGIPLVGKILDGQNIPFMCVNSLPEANLLRGAGVKTEVLIMGYVEPGDMKLYAS